MSNMEKNNLSLNKKITLGCSNFTYFALILIPFVASFSSAAVNVFIGLLVFAFLLKKILTKDISITRTPLNFPFLLLIIISLVSFTNSVNIHSSIQGIGKLLKYGFLLIILAGELKDRGHIKKIVAASILGLLLASLDGVYQLIFGVDFFRHHPYDTMIGLARLKAAFPHTNIFAGYLALFLPLPLSLFLYHSRGIKKFFLGAVAAAGLFCLIFTFCRSAVFGFWLAMLITGFIRKDKLIIAILIAVVLVAPFLAPKGIHDWSKKTSSVAEFLLNKERFALYETSFNMIKHHPVLGVGVNTYCLNYQNYKLHNTSEGTADTMWYAHNSFLQMTAEIGIIGFLVFLYLLFKLFKSWRAFYRKVNDNFQKIAGLGIFMGIFAFLIHGLTETNLYYPKIATLFWFQIGLLTGLLHLNKEGAK